MPFFFNETWVYYFWHEARGPGVIFNRSQISDKFVSPVLFPDGHAARHDFSQEITSRFNYPAEPTRDWYFYEPLQSSP